MAQPDKLIDLARGIRPVLSSKADITFQRDEDEGILTSDVPADGPDYKGDYGWARLQLGAHVTVDLVKPSKLDHVSVYLYDLDVRTLTFRLDVADDGKTWKPVVEKAIFPSKGERGCGQLDYPLCSKMLNERWRYVRFTALASTSSKQVHLIRIQAYGPPPEEKAAKDAAVRPFMPPAHYSYEERITKCRVVILTGAGASAPLGVPLERGKSKNGLAAEIGARAKKFFEKLPAGDTRTHAERLWQLVEATAEQNVERWLTLLGGLRDIAGSVDETQDLKLDLASQGVNIKDVSLKSADYAFKCLCAAYLEAIESPYLEDQGRFSVAARELYDPLVKAVADYTGGLCVIFTTNHDSAIDCLDMSPEHPRVADGFMGKITRYNPNAFSEEVSAYEAARALNSSAKLIVQMKLHGSSSFRLRNGVVWKYPVVPERGITLEDARSAVLFPTLTKEVAGEPFFSYYGYLRECLKEADKFISIGYSYGDRLLATWVKHGFETNPKMRGLIVGRIQNRDLFEPFGEKIECLEEECLFEPLPEGQPLMDAVGNLLKT